MNAYRWAELHEGLTHEFIVEVTREMVDAFRAVSGDTNPLHRDATFARQAGFKDVVVFGLLVSAFYSQLVGVHLPGELALLHGLDVDFVKPVFVGDRLVVSGAVSHLSEASRQAELRARIVNQDGVLVSKAKIRVGVHER